jgi:hypothetical protein
LNTPLKIFACVLLIVTTLLLAGCPPRVSIRDINRDPGRYANRDISVGGRF